MIACELCIALVAELTGDHLYTERNAVAHNYSYVPAPTGYNSALVTGQVITDVQTSQYGATVALACNTADHHSTVEVLIDAHTNILSHDPVSNIRPGHTLTAQGFIERRMMWPTGATTPQVTMVFVADHVSWSRQPVFAYVDDRVNEPPNHQHVDPHAQPHMVAPQENPSGELNYNAVASMFTPRTEV